MASQGSSMALLDGKERFVIHRRSASDRISVPIAIHNSLNGHSDGSVIVGV